MDQERQYAYKIQATPDCFTGIMYHLGAYYVAIFKQGEKGLIARTIRKYKTLRGAENYLLADYSHAERTAPEISYGTEKFIKAGSYWKGE